MSVVPPRWGKLVAMLCLVLQVGMFGVVLWHQTSPDRHGAGPRNPWWRGCPPTAHIHVTGHVSRAADSPAPPECRGALGKRSPRPNPSRHVDPAGEQHPCPPMDCLICSHSELLRHLIGGDPVLLPACLPLEERLSGCPFRWVTNRRFIPCLPRGPPIIA